MFGLSQHQGQHKIHGRTCGCGTATRIPRQHHVCIEQCKTPSKPNNYSGIAQNSDCVCLFACLSFEPQSASKSSSLAPSRFVPKRARPNVLQHHWMPLSFALCSICEMVGSLQSALHHQDAFDLFFWKMAGMEPTRIANRTGIWTGLWVVCPLPTGFGALCEFQWADYPEFLHVAGFVAFCQWKSGTSKHWSLSHLWSKQHKW